MFNTQMPKDSLMLWIFDGDEISKNIGEYKTTIANEPARVRCCFIADMKKIDGKVVFYTTELVRYLYCLNLRSRTRYLNPSLHTPQRARTCLLVGHSPPLYLRKHLNMRLKINNIAKIRVKLVMNAK